MQYKGLEVTTIVFVSFIVFGLCKADKRCFPNGTIVVPIHGGHFNKVDVESETCRLRGSGVHEELWLDNCQMNCGANGNTNRHRAEKRSSSGLRSDFAILTIQYDATEVLSLARKPQCPSTTPSIWMVTSLIYLVFSVL